jgi:hypothetical protein
MLSLLVPSGVLALAAACTLSGDDLSSWRSQLVPDSPCYEVNLLDSLDTSSTAELHALFACLNRGGQLAPLEPTTATLDRPAGAATVGTSLTAAIGALRDVDVDVFSLVGMLGDALSDEAAPVQTAADVVLELISGEPAHTVRDGGVDLRDAAVLRAGPLSTSTPLWVPLATSLRAPEGAATRHLLARVLTEPDLRRWLFTIDAWLQTPDADLAALIDRVPQDLGEALLAVEDTSNDRWIGATGNSLRDLLDLALLDDAPLLDDIQEDAAAILADTHLRDALPGAVLTLDDDGHLDGILSGVAWMSSINAEGRPLARGETSALASFLRLLHDANRPVDCRASVLGVGINVRLGNLSVKILGILADQDAGFVVSASSLLSGALSAPLGDAAVNALVDSGLCPVITPRMVDDLDALGVLERPQAADLLEALVVFLDLLQDGDEDRLPAVADIASALVDRGALDPLEEVVRDLGPSQLAADLVSALAPLTSPDRFGLRGRDLIRLADLLDLAEWAFVPRDDGGEGAGWTLLLPVIEPIWQRPALWSTARTAADLLTTEDTQAHDLMSVVPALLRIDPEYQTLDLMSALLGQDAVATLLLDAVSEGSMVDTLLTPEPLGADPRTPLGWTAELIVDGTLDDLLHTAGLVLDGLNEVAADPPTP